MVVIYSHLILFGGVLASTWIAKPKVHVEDCSSPRKTSYKNITAKNDSKYDDAIDAGDMAVAA